MADTPWLTIVGIGEDGAAGLSASAKAALADADVVSGATRHLALLPRLTGEVVPWPVPFDAGIPGLLGHRGRKTVMLVSGDPFWFGAGTSITRHLDAFEWIAHPVPSTFALAAARLGWPLDDTACLGLHAAPLARLRRHIAPTRHALVLVRDGEAVAALARYLTDLGFGGSRLHILEALGGPRERVREMTAAGRAFGDIAHPVAVGIAFAGTGAVLPQASGLPDAWFEHDGQITKRPIRALTLSALAPKPGETLWDIGAGSGSIGIEWLLAHPSTQATAFEADPVRAARIQGNAAALGADRLRIVEGRALDVLEGQAEPDAIFIGGGLSDALLERLWSERGPGTRLIANAVTLESEALLIRWQGMKGGTLMRIDLSEAVPLGTRRGWRASYPVMHWSVVL
ncbi:bifunctional cobalt-precorrin-7 (C(5))-methyltransferase/cobalt-precorrin-6B (C(15))-methyltransferase [Sphingomonas sp. Leaf38]|uniref:bifunctional cobalt-precorrin-7 (C(5))-methyltransferase/cobalt-precorrin-6B (C(15))-methyltransferase n=1 Tax=Sphingomonas sp. Leaf38 TaxID=1736217 RepID=UPI0006F71F67|nr:bifunctional cobalt-precorrin-7 (C(5))-methyltransferase/cobalt-precorrin-6B (C(15))-methyltransferase [Sphingomonas sp. Leaf38]KQN32949.1 precorrin-6Y methyltransferase [Sphingomonas sp. Leaf38]